MVPRRSTTLMALATLSFFLSTPALANEEFGGNWKLDPELSKGMRPNAPTDVRLDVQVRGTDLVVTRTAHVEGEDRTMNYTYVADGEPHELPGPGGSTRTASAEWKGKKLRVTYKLNFGGPELNVVETWSLKKKGLEVKYVTDLLDRKFVTKQLYVRQ